MIKGGERKPHVEGRHGNRVSSAVWPVNVRRVVATGKAAQRRRDWIMQGRWWIILVDALSMRILFILTTLLVVVSSLLVAALGLHFWYILVAPLLLFALVLIVPIFLASRTIVEATPPLSAFAQEWKSSTGMLSLYAQELKSNPGFLQELKSNPGFLQELKSNPGYLQELKSNPGFLQALKSNPGVLSGEAPATPMPADPPLVRVLETYDLRGMPVKQALDKRSEGETGTHTAVQYMEREFWKYSAGTEPLAPDHTLYHQEDSSSEPDIKRQEDTP